MADTSIIITDMISQFGAYYQAAGQGMQSIRQKLFYGFGSASAFTLMPTNDTVVRLSEAEVTDVLQPYQDTYTSKGGVTFTPFEMTLKQIKVDQQFNPNKLVQSWLGFLTSNSTDRTTWPFIRWFIEAYLVPKIAENMELKVVYNGVYAAPSSGTAGDPEDAVDGVKKIINDLITASKVTPYATGTLATAPEDFVTQLEDFIKTGVSPLYWNIGMELNMSRMNAMKFKEGMRKKYNVNYAQVGDLMSFLDYNINVVARDSMVGSDKVWMTPKANAIYGIKGGENANTFELEKVDRTVKIYTDWFLGFGFVQPSLIFTNDQDLS